MLDELGIVVGRVDERDRQDAHQGAVALVPLVGPAGLDRPARQPEGALSAPAVAPPMSKAPSPSGV